MDVPTDNTRQRVEQKYIELLEKRVAALEAKLGPEALVPEPTTGSRNEKTRENDNSAAKDAEPVQNQSAKIDETQQRYVVVINSLDSESGEYVDRSPTTPVPDPKLSKDSQRAFTLRKRMRQKIIGVEEVPRCVGTEVEIESEHLQKLLAHVTNKFTSLPRVTQMESPFQDLIWSWEEAEKEAAEMSEDVEMNQARTDLRVLLDMISKSSGNESLDRYFKSRKTMLEEKSFTFESLWTIFPTGSLILSRPFFNLPQVFMVQNCFVPDPDEEDRAQFKIIAYSYDWNGSSYNRVPYPFSLKFFTEKRPIFQLPFYPLKEHGLGDIQDDGKGGVTAVEKLRADLINRGKKFVGYCQAKDGRTFRYDGPAFLNTNATLFGKEPEEDDDSMLSRSFRDSRSTRNDEIKASKDTSSHLTGSIVIDFESYMKFQFRELSLGNVNNCGSATECMCADCRRSLEKIRKFSWDGQKDNLSDEQLLLLPPRLLGYALNQKTWVQVVVDQVREKGVADPKNFNDKLILSEDNKDIIRKAVLAHGSNNITDYIPGKGKGLVILLWGVPGVGKTLTAESVTALANRPLLSIGVSDIGTKSTEVEGNLERTFALAALWKAVLLFDEADVFLEARGGRGSDIARNTMVSVLLRILEYYEGILILTTNRLKTFDMAVQSRVHIAVEYSDLNKEQRKKIFEEFLGQLNAKGLVEDIDTCMQWVGEEGQNKTFNGRQIRNIVYTAMSLAHTDKSPLRRGHLVQVAQNTETFQRALQDQEAVFRNNQIRARFS
ncbi:hypothetical protein G7054_g8120 [Neopestalotiopsis clavispora]|nr:hypothetical protein G7054_g8120 [Neopestalotiopsis clavispora]